MVEFLKANPAFPFETEEEADIFSQMEDLKGTPSDKQDAKFIHILNSTEN